MSSAPSPPVSMLWEDADPVRVLSERFGHADPAAAYAWIARVVEQGWRRRVISCERIVMSDSNALAWLTSDDGPLIAKWSIEETRFPLLTSLGELTRHLDGQGVPVSAPIPPAQGGVRVRLDSASVELQRVIAGDLLDPSDPAEVDAAGAALARLHAALAACPAIDGVPEPDGTVPERIGRWVDGRSGDGLDEVRTTLRQLLDSVPDRDPGDRQIVHGDIRSANILCRGGEVAAFLDFEEARVDLPLVEVARGAVMLGTRFRGWGPVPADVRAAFIAGYAQARPLTAAEQAWLPAVELWAALAMVPEGDDPTGWEESARAIARTHR